MTQASQELDHIEGSFSAMLALVKVRTHFRRLMIGNMISQLGEWLSYIAVSLLTVSSGEGGVALATAYLSHSLPNALVAPFAGRVADRFDRRKVMIYAYLAASIATILMFIAAIRGDIWTLQALTFVRTSLSSFGMNARQASIPSLVSPSELYTANALNSLIWSSLFTLGVALGGALTATVGAQTAIGIDALTYFFAIATIWKLPTLQPPDDLHTSEGQGKQQEPSHQLTRTSGLWACWRFARQDHRLAAALLAKCPLGIVNSAGWMTLTLLASHTFGDTTGVILGLFHACRAIGTGVGPLVLRTIWPHSALVTTLWAIPVTIALLLSKYLIFSIPCLLIWGMLLGYTWVRSSAYIQALSPAQVIGRLSAFELSCATVSQATSILVVGLVYDLQWGLPLGVSFSLAIALLLGLWLYRLEQQPISQVLPSK